MKESEDVIRQQLWDQPDPKPSGVKHDLGKSQLNIIDPSFLDEVGMVFAAGAQKYDRGNYRLGMNWSRVIDASMRHILAFSSGEDLDPETKLLHLAHAGACMSILTDYYVNQLGTDDRLKRTVRRERNPL